MSAPALRFAEYVGVELPAVPTSYLDFLAAKDNDLWPQTEGQIEAELKRRTATASAALDEATEPLYGWLRGSEECLVPIRCPQCGHDVDSW